MSEQKPGFFFYPGDYLRDTQCLGEKAQVAYDRIMCEHMRNICISQKRLDFFTKKLLAEEIEELMTVLKIVDGGFQIIWVGLSINKYEAYRQSRSKNRTPKKEKDINDISSTYDPHMESESEIDKEEDKDLRKSENPLPKTDVPVRQPVVQAMADGWKSTRPDYPFDETTDMHALFEIGTFLANVLKIPWLPDKDADYIALQQAWKCLEAWQKQDDFYKSFSLAYLAKTKTLQTIWQKSKEVKNGTTIIPTGSGNRKSVGANQLLGKLKANLGAHAGGEQGSGA